MKRNIRTPLTVDIFLSFLQKVSLINPNALNKILKEKQLYYYCYSIPKKAGGKRTITPSRGPLKIVQKTTKLFIDNIIKWPRYLHGGIRKRSVLTNAEHHTGQYMVVNLDIKDCFDNTTLTMVKKGLLDLGLENRLTKLISDICTHNNCLPQGAPTSTSIANIALNQIDKRIYRLCKKKKFQYTRFVDNITISADSDLRSYKNVFLDPIYLSGHRPSEYSCISKSKCQVVTGLVVNDKIKPTKEFIKQLKDDIKSAWPEHNTLELAAHRHGLTIGQFKTNIRGRINFVKSINKKLGREIRGLAVKMVWP